MRISCLALTVGALIFVGCDKPDPPAQTPAPPPAAPPPDTATKTPPPDTTKTKAVAPAPTTPRPAGGLTSTLTGVYSPEQAKRGETAYGLQCASCHNSLGNHTGPVFRQNWAGATVADLFLYMTENMPKGDPGSLSPQEYVDLTAYLLKMNGMPAGKTALPPDAVALAAFRFDTLPGSNK